MRTRTLSLISLLGLSLVGAACRSDGSKNNPDGGGGSGSGSGSGSGDGGGSGDIVTTIQQVQDDATPVGTAVALSGVVVTAIDAYGTRTGDIWVEDPNGGEYSGVHVFGADTSAVANLAVGDVVTIVGAVKSEFTITGDTASSTEIQGAGSGHPTVTKTGTAAVPDAHVLDAAALGAMTEADARTELEKWEGVLVKVNNVAAQGAPACILSQHVCSDATRTSFDVDGFLVLESSLAAFDAAPPASPTIAQGTCIASATGVLDYAFDYDILNTGALVETGGTCAVVTGNVTTIPAIQAATPTGAIELDNVYVTAIAHSKRSFWVSTDLAAAPNNGVFVFGNSTLAAGIVVGAKVNVVGTVSEFNDDTNGGTLTEIAPTGVTVVAAPGTTLPSAVTGKTATDLLVPATAPTYESVLVTLTDVNITAFGTATNGFEGTAVQNGTTFGFGTDIMQPGDTNTTLTTGCKATVTGFWTNLEAGGAAATTKPNAFGFIPREVSAAAGTCN